MDVVAEAGDVHKWVRAEMVLWGLWLLFQSVILTEELVHLQAKSPWVDACMTTWFLFLLSKLMCASLLQHKRHSLYKTAWHI